MIGGVTMPNLFPTVNMPMARPTPASRKVKFGRSWKFDFDVGEFVLTPTRKVVEADETEAYYEWCQKALITVRRQYVIYSSDYGSDLKTLFQTALGRSAIESEIRRMVTECLMVDPRTASVEHFSFMRIDDTVAFDCLVNTAKGSEFPLTGQVEVRS